MTCPSGNATAEHGARRAGCTERDAGSARPPGRVKTPLPRPHRETEGSQAPPGLPGRVGRGQRLAPRPDRPSPALQPELCHCFAAAQAAGICYVTSTYASRTLEDIAAAAPRGLRWLQLYVQTDRQLNEQLIQRAESLGFKALVITVDTPKIGKRRRDIRNQLDLEKMIMLMDLRSPKEVGKTPGPMGRRDRR